MLKLDANVRMLFDGFPKDARPRVALPQQKLLILGKRKDANLRCCAAVHTLIKCDELELSLAPALPVAYNILVADHGNEAAPLGTPPLTHSPNLTHPSAFPQIEVCAQII